MQAPPGKTVDDEIFCGIFHLFWWYSVYAKQYRQKTEPFFGDQQATGNFIYRITI
jgi:hypothetical protein